MSLLPTDSFGAVFFVVDVLLAALPAVITSFAFASAVFKGVVFPEEEVTF